MIKLGIVGCGDVAFRTYFPGLERLAGQAIVAACCDGQIDRAERAAAAFPGARAYASYEELLHDGTIDGIINLTPAPFHHEVNAAALEAGLHVFTEKPLAGTIEQCDALIALAERMRRVLLCAPAIMATPRFRWLREIVAAGRIGRPTLATAQMANMGPAAWRDYTGDPAVFYGSGVGPLLDTGVYPLHAITGLLGPARRVQAFGGIAIPQRTVLAGAHAGRVIDVSANDQMLLHLDFGQQTFAQVVSSFTVSGSKAPFMELHGTRGSISIEDWYSAGVHVLLRDDSPLGLSGWLEAEPPLPGPITSVIANGPAHFVACLQGAEQPLLTAQHARHVLEIMLKADESIHAGRALELTTRF